MLVIYFTVNIYRHFLKNKQKKLAEPLLFDLNMYATVCYFGSHHHTWVVSKGKKIMLLLRLPVFLIDCNLICIETCNCKVFLLEVNNKFTAFFWVNFVTAAVLIHLTVKLQPLMVPLIMLNTFQRTLVDAKFPFMS